MNHSGTVCKFWRPHRMSEGEGARNLKIRIQLRTAINSARLLVFETRSRIKCSGVGYHGICNYNELNSLPLFAQYSWNSLWQATWKLLVLTEKITPTTFAIENVENHGETRLDSGRSRRKSSRIIRLLILLALLPSPLAPLRRLLLRLALLPYHHHHLLLVLWV